MFGILKFFLILKIFVWTLLGTILGIFGTLKLFWFFWKFSKTRPSMEHWAKNFFEKITPKLVQNTLGHFLERFWAFLEFWIFFLILKIFVWTLLGTILGIFGFLKLFLIFFWKFLFGHFWGRFWAILERWNFFDLFENFRRLDPPWNIGENIFRKNHPKTFSKHVWTFWDRIWAFLEFWIFFDFFEKVRRLDPPSNTGQKFFFGKINPKLVQNTFGHFWERFWAFLEFWHFFDFFWKFPKTQPSMEHCAKNFLEKITLKQLQNTFGHFWERFWACLEFWIFFWFWKFSFGHFWGRFWAFLEIWNFFDFFENFRRLDPPWNTGWKNFRKNHPKTSSKHVWTLLRTILGIFGILKIFGFFWKFSKTRPSMEHWAKNFLEKITLKQLQNTFGHFWERFWACLEFWNFFWIWKFSFGLFWGRFWAFLELWSFFDFFENFRRLDPPWNTGQKIFSKKSP